MDSRSTLLCGAVIVMIIGICLVGLGFLIVSKPDLLWENQLAETSFGLGEHPNILIGKQKLSIED